MFKKNNIKRKKIIKIVVLVLLLFLFLVFIWFQFNLWRFSFLKKKIAAKRIEYVLDNSYLDRGEGSDLLDYYLKILLSSKDDDFVSKNIVYLLQKENVESKIKIQIVKYLMASNYLEENLELNEDLEKLSQSGLLDYSLKIFLLNNFSNLNDDRNMIEYLKVVFLDETLSLTQRKVALRSLWTTFNDSSLYFFYRQILFSDSNRELQKEAIKALSSLGEKDKFLEVKDLDVYEKFLNGEDYELEKITLFLLSNYYYIYPQETKDWFRDKKVSSVNQFLANELFK